MPEDLFARYAGENPYEWEYARIPDDFFHRLEPEEGLISRQASPSEVIKAIYFWRSLPFRWERLKRGGAKDAPKTAEDMAVLDNLKVYKHPPSEELILSVRLMVQFTIAHNAILTAAEAEGLDSLPIKESGEICRGLLGHIPIEAGNPEHIIDRSRRGVWPYCVLRLFEGESSMDVPRKALEVAESILAKLEVRMMMRGSRGQFPGGAPMERQAGKAPRTGRPERHDAKEDKRIAEAWATGHYEKYEELGRELKLDPDPKKAAKKVRRAIDRHRHRKARRG